MDEMRDLEKRLNEQIDSIAAIEDLGINQISTRNYGFDALLLEADELVKRILSSANRNEDGTLVSKDKPQRKLNDKKIISLVVPDSLCIKLSFGI